ncbi:MAG: phosphoribosylformylglycinamidine synthase subunit PurS [Candidatus Bathyarchaeota archaeon]|nr:MAG: phosphoribosylformylglycinamidine synthase subunit PurS [Candidatus Bathyarchaeota archaeon]
MLYQALVKIHLKPGHSDPEGEMTARALKELLYPVKSVRVNKNYIILLESKSKSMAEARVEDMCKRLLANPTKDEYAIQVEKAR